jgi:DNA-binding NtrC family response regulator
MAEILIVDDDMIFSDMLSDVITEMGIPCRRLPRLAAASERRGAGV